MSKLFFFLGSRCTLAVLFLTLGAAPCPAQSSSDPPQQQSDDADQQIPPAIAKQLDAMRQRIDELEAELKASREQAHPDTAVTSAKATVPVATNATANAAAPAAFSSSAAAIPTTATSATAPTNASVPTASASTEAKVAKVEPFSDADWTWLNGNPRTKEIFWDTKFFTPEIRADAVYVYDFNHPTDHSIGGSSELFRSQEVQLDATRRWRRLPLRQCSRPVHDAVRHVFRNDAAERPKSRPRPVGSCFRVPLPIGSVRRLSLRQAARRQRGCRNLYVIHRLVQLLQIRQLGVPAVLRFVEYAMVFQRRARADFPHGAFEDRAVVHQWMAVVCFGQSHGQDWEDRSSGLQNRG